MGIIEPRGKMAVSTQAVLSPLDRPLKFLSPRDMYAIDEALAAIGAFGEVRLVKNRGRLRFIQTVKSEDLAAFE